MLTNTNGCGSSTTPYIDVSLLHDEYYRTSRLGILTKYQLSKTFKDANNYPDPIENICLHYLTSRVEYFQFFGCEPPMKTDRYGDLHISKRAQSVDCQTSNRNDIEYLMRALNVPGLCKYKSKIEKCLSSIRYENHIAQSEHACGLRFCPHCGAVKAKKKLDAFRVGLQLTEEKCNRLFECTITTTPIECKADLIKQREQELTKGVSRFLTSSKYVRSAKNKKGVITGSSRTIETVYIGNNQVLVHIHFAMTLEGMTNKGAWLKEEMIIEELKKHIPSFQDLHIKRYKASHSISSDQITNILSYHFKPLDISVMDRPHTDDEKLKKGIDPRFRTFESSVSKQPLKYWRSYLVAIKGTRREAHTGFFKRTLALGSAELKKRKKDWQERFECLAGDNPGFVHANFRPQHIVDKNGEHFDCGEYVLDQFNARLLVKEVEDALNAQIYFNNNPLNLVSSIRRYEHENPPMFSPGEDGPKKKSQKPSKAPYKPKERYNHQDSQLSLIFKDEDFKGSDNQSIVNNEQSLDSYSRTYTTSNIIVGSWVTS
jgi:hypothetical protein